MKRFLSSFRYGQRGFTLIELLIVVAVLGALAAVVVPAVAAFIGTANLAAANTEANNVKTGAMSYLADNGGFPDDSAALYGGAVDYISQDSDGYYTFDNASGQILTATPSPDGITSAFTWNAEKQLWER